MNFIHYCAMLRLCTERRMTALVPSRKRTRLPESVRRGQLIVAARKVFRAKGFRDAAIADIVREAGVGLGTFYNYFSSKHEIVFALNRWCQERYADALRNAYDPNAPFEETIRTMTAVVFQHARESADLVRLFNFGMESVSSEAMTERVNNHPIIKFRTEVFEQAIVKGEMEPMDARLAARIVYATMRNALVDVHLLEDEDGARRYEETLSQFLYQGLRRRTPLSANLLNGTDTKVKHA